MTKQLLHYKATRNISSMAGVIEEMKRIDRLARSSNWQNLVAFNTTYLIITEAVNAELDTGYFSFPDQMEKIDKIFANYYFTALENFLNNKPCPPAWEKLFSHIHSNNYQYIFMALGVNAHVNNDLPQSLLDAETPDTFLDDFLKVNYLIKESLSRVIYSLPEKSLSIGLAEKIFVSGYAYVLNYLIQNWRKNAWSLFQLLREDQKILPEIELRAGVVASRILGMGKVKDLYKISELLIA